ncbi:MAG: hypothetical protein P4L31_02430, partial [Candidatus Babeliales bacterium]|nr:hypothetical protein [Candidatus Babeliales bacterium]
LTLNVALRPIAHMPLLMIGTKLIPYNAPAALNLIALDALLPTKKTYPANKLYVANWTTIPKHGYKKIQSPAQRAQRILKKIKAVIT